MDVLRRSELFYLGLSLPGVLHPLALKTEAASAVLIFKDLRLAQAHLNDVGSDWRLQKLEADDLRAKEELLRAALLQNAPEVWLDTSLERLEAEKIYATRRALDYILSFKNQAACL